MLLLFLYLHGFACSNQSDSKPHTEVQIELPLPTFPNPPNGFRSGLAARNGDLWFASYGGGLYRFDGKQFFHFTPNDGLCSDSINTLMEDKQGNIWIGTVRGLCKYDGHAFQFTPLPFQDTTSIWLDKVYPIINPNAVHAIIQDRKGDLYIGTGGGGAYHYDRETFTSILADKGRRYEDGQFHNWIADIAEDPNGNIWFASMSYAGLTRYDGQNYTEFSAKDGLSDDMVRKIHIGKSGKIWLGFNGNRESVLTVFDGKSFHLYNREDQVCHRNIWDMYEDAKGRLWMAGGQGICVLAENQIQEFRDQNQQPYQGTTFIIGDQNQNIWFGGRNGLWKHNETETIQITTPQ